MPFICQLSMHVAYMCVILTCKCITYAYIHISSHTYTNKDPFFHGAYTLAEEDIKACYILCQKVIIHMEKRKRTGIKNWEDRAVAFKYSG